MVCAICNLKIGVFEHLEITFPMNFYQRVAYTHRSLRVSALKEYNTNSAECKELAKGLARKQCTLVPTKDVTMDPFWTWKNTDANNDSRDMYLVATASW